MIEIDTLAEYRALWPDCDQLALSITRRRRTAFLLGCLAATLWILVGLAVLA